MRRASRRGQGAGREGRGVGRRVRGRQVPRAVGGVLGKVVLGRVDNVGGRVAVGELLWLLRPRALVQVGRGVGRVVERLGPTRGRAWLGRRVRGRIGELVLGNIPWVRGLVVVARAGADARPCRTPRRPRAGSTSPSIDERVLGEVRLGTRHSLAGLGLVLGDAGVGWGRRSMLVVEVGRGRIAWRGRRRGRVAHGSSRVHILALARLLLRLRSAKDVVERVRALEVLLLRLVSPLRMHSPLAPGPGQGESKKNRGRSTISRQR